MRTRMLRTGAAVLACAGLGGCWLAPGQGPDRRADNPFETGLTAANVATLTEAWSADTGDVRVGPPVVSGGGVHVVAADQLVTLAARTGTERWRTPDEPTGIATASDPIVRGGEVIIGVGYGNLGGHWQATAYDVDDGTPRSLPVTALVDGVRGTTAATRSVAFGSGTPVLNTVGVRDLTTGAGWSGMVTFEDRSSPYFGQAPLTLGEDGLFQAGGGTLSPTPPGTASGWGVRRFALTQPANCAPSPTYPYAPCPTWATPVDGAPTSPLLTGRAVVVGTATGTVHALDAADGSVLWTRSVAGAVRATPAFADGLLYVVTAAGDLTVLDGDTGEPVWGAAGLGTLSVQPAVAGGVVYVASGDGTVRAFAAAGCGAATCAPLWQDDTGDAAITGAPAAP